MFLSVFFCSRYRGPQLSLTFFFDIVSFLCALLCSAFSMPLILFLFSKLNWHNDFVCFGRTHTHAYVRPERKPRDATENFGSGVEGQGPQKSQRSHCVRALGASRHGQGALWYTGGCLDAYFLLFLNFFSKSILEELVKRES